MHMQKGFRRDVIMSVALVLGAFLVAGSVLAWSAASMRDTVTAIMQKRAALEQYGKTVDLLANLKKMAPQITSYEEKMNLLLPRKDDLLAFSPWLDGVSRVNNVAIGAFAFQGATMPAGETEAGHLGFTLDASGTHEKVSQFFRAIELRSNKFLVQIDSLDLTESGGVARARAKGRVFFR